MALICTYHSSPGHQLLSPQGFTLSTPTPPTIIILLCFLLGSPQLAMSCQHQSGLCSSLFLTLQTNAHPSSHLRVPRSLGAASSPTFIPHFTPPGKFFLQPLRRTERIAPFPQSSCSDSILGHRISARSRTRWLLLQTLINNPRLVVLRKSKPSHGSREFTQTLLTCSDC